MFSLLILAIAFLSLIALMIIHEFGHFIIAKKFGVRVDEFGIGYPPRMFGKKIGETIYSINWLPLGAFVKIYGEEGGVDDLRSFANLKIWKRVLIVIGGVVAFWIAAIVLFSIVFMIGTDLPVGDQDFQGVKNIRVQITEVLPGSPALEAGIKARDIITGVTILSPDSSKQPEITPIKKLKDFQDFTKTNAGKPILIKLTRGEKNIELSLTPRVNPPAGQGAVGIGLDRFATLMEKYPWYSAPVQGTIYTWKTTVNSLVALGDTFKNLFVGRGLPQGAAFAGPLGITVFLANAANYGLGFFLYFIGNIAVLVAIFNLFPIPALDGGKLIFLLIEKIKKRPVSVKIEQTITIVFFVILICLSLFITFKFDIPRFIDFVKASVQK